MAKRQAVTVWEQGNLTYALGIDTGALSSLEVLTRTATAQEAIRETATGDIIPASPALSGAPNMLTELGKEFRLREALEPIRGNYDYILIDTSPALSVLTINALTASDKLIIPSGADMFSLQGIVGIINTVDSVRKYCNNPDLRIDGILLTRYNSRANLTKEIMTFAEQIASMMQTEIYQTTIRENISIREAQANRLDIFAYDRRCNGAVDYGNFIEEFLKGR